MLYHLDSTEVKVKVKDLEILCYKTQSNMKIDQVPGIKLILCVLVDIGLNFYAVP